MTARRLVPWESTSSRWELRGLVVVGVLLLLAYVAAALLFARSTGNRGLTIDAVPPPGGVALGLEVVSIDTQTSSARARMHLDVAPELTDDAGQLTESITVIGILQGKSEWVFPKGQRPGVIDVQMYLDGAVEDYPLDRWVTLFGGLAFPTSTDADGLGGEPLPTAVAVESSLPGWVTREISLDEFFDTVPGTSVEGPVSTVGLRFSRAGSTLAIVFLVLALMVVLAVLGVVVAVAVARGRRRIEPTLTGFLAALLFALIPLRNVLPGAPPLGAWIDMLVFFWVEILLMTALALYVVTWLTKGPRPDRAAPVAEPADAVPVPDVAPVPDADAGTSDADDGGRDTIALVTQTGEGRTSTAAVAVDVPAVQRRTVRVLSGSQALTGVAVAGAIPAGSLIAAGVAGNEAAAGFAQTFGVVGAALAALPLARLTISGGRRRALSAGLGLGAVGAVLVVIGAQAGVLALIYLGCLFVGCATAAGYQARYAAADLAEPHHVGRALSIVVWASTVGAVLGPNLLETSGRLALVLGLPQLAGPYVVAAVVLALAVLLLQTFLRPDPYLVARRLARVPGEVRGKASASLRTGLSHVRRHPRAQLGIAAVALGHAVMVMVMVMTPVHMRHVDVRLQLIGLVISVHVAGMYALSPVVGWAADTLGRLRVLGAGVVLLTAACVISGVVAADDVVGLGIGLFLLGLGWSCTLIAGSILLVEDVDTPDRPAVQGASDLTMNVAGAVGGALAGVIVAVASYGLLCAVALLPVLALGLATLRPACREPSNTRSG